MAAATFPDIPAHKSSPGQEVTFRTNKATFGDGYEQASGDGIHGQKDKWTLVWENADKDDMDTVVSFLEGQQGYLPFFWTPPRGNTGTVLWKCESYTRSGLNTLSDTINAVFERWFGAEP